MMGVVGVEVEKGWHWRDKLPKRGFLAVVLLFLL
jgi:hypothetical protein